MDFLLQDESREFSVNDAQELLNIVCIKEDIVQKKRKFLQSSAYISFGKIMLPRRRYKFMDEKFIPESSVRSDEVSSDIVRSAVGESFRFFDNYRSENHVVADSLDLFNANVMQTKERILSIIGDLTNAALYSIACIVSRNNLKSKGTRPELIEVVKNHLMNFLLDTSEDRDELHQMSKLFKNPNSYLQTNQQIVTPVTKNLLVSVSKTLEILDELTIRELNAIFRRLSGVKVKPHFPPVINNHDSTKEVLLRVKRLCYKYWAMLEEGQEMPKEFASGLTVAILSIYSRLGHPNMLISEFYHFPENVMCTQMAILNALRSLEKLQMKEMEPLVCLIDPNGIVARSTFRSQLKKYMIEYLFVCDEISVPSEVLRAVDLINKRPQVESNLFSKENRDKEVEAVLDVSCYLKSVLMNALEEVNEDSADVEEVEGEEYDGGLNKPYSDYSDFEFCGTDFFFSSVSERFGKDLEAASSNCILESVNSLQGNSFRIDSCSITKKSSEKQNDRSQVCSSKAGRELEINEICDEAALVAHKLIGHVIDGFLKLEKREVDGSTISYLTDGIPSDNNHRDGKAKANVDEESAILFDAVEKILPSLPKSSLDKIKSLMGP